MDLMKGIEVLQYNKTFKYILAVLLHIGNFLNGAQVSLTLPRSLPLSLPHSFLSLYLLPSLALVPSRAGTNTPSDEYDSHREYRVANTNMYSRIHFFLRGY